MRLHIVNDYSDASDEMPTKPGGNDVRSGDPEGAVVYRIVCPYHHIPWAKVIAVQFLIVAAACLVACAVGR